MEHLKLLFSWVLGSICVLVGGVLLAGIGYTGTILRNGITLLRGVRRAEKEVSHDRSRLTPQWHAARRRSWLMIGACLGGWVALYGIVAIVLPLTWFLLSLGLLVLPMLGFFGILIGIGED